MKNYGNFDGGGGGGGGTVKSAKVKRSFSFRRGPTKAGTASLAVRLARRTTRAPVAGDEVLRPVATASGLVHLMSGEHAARPDALHTMVREGLGVNEVRPLAKDFGMSANEFAALCGLSKSTFARKQKEKKPAARRLAPENSDTVMRFASLLARASAVFGHDKDAATQWLRTPQVGLGGAIPLEYAQSSMGCREVEKLLTRIEYSVYA